MSLYIHFPLVLVIQENSFIPFESQVILSVIIASLHFKYSSYKQGLFILIEVHTNGLWFIFNDDYKFDKGFSQFTKLVIS